MKKHPSSGRAWNGIQVAYIGRDIVSSLGLEDTQTLSMPICGIKRQGGAEFESHGHKQSIAELGREMESAA
ncbi:hypothetical protein RsS62_06730 [Rhizobium dioscoreae]|nr:hypothetical protein RsS62_06730 [Rhizobium dioscoreae]